MAAPRSMAKFQSCIALRGSEGVWVVDSDSGYKLKDDFPRSHSSRCKAMCFSTDGTLFAFCDGTSIKVISVADDQVITDIDKPKTACLQFSPRNTLLASWEPYAVTKDQPAGTPNLNLWEVQSGTHVKGFVQKKNQGWCPQWSSDEEICARLVNFEVHFYERNNFKFNVCKIQVQKVTDFKLPPNSLPPYNVAAYVPGTKGQPSFVRLFQYPNFGAAQSALANKSFYKAEKVDLVWNKKGSAMVILTTIEASQDSYYGDQGLHYIDVLGQSCLVPRAKNGPVYCVEWNPNSTEFCVIYGLMPAKATLYNLKCEPIFDFGTGPRNLAYYNPQGNILCLAGFGNLHGNIEFWDIAGKKLVHNTKASDTTFFEWAPDGEYIMTATTSPRLRVNNGFRISHYTGVMVHESSTMKEQELWEVAWRPAPEGTFPPPRVQGTGTLSSPEAQQSKAYVPPGLRNRTDVAPNKPKYREAYELPSNLKKPETPQTQEPLSKSALKNKKKREAKKAKQDQQVVSANPAQSQYAGGQHNPVLAAAPTCSPEKDKQIRNLRKKLQQIEKLKQQQAAGKTLEINQLEKLKTESTIIQQMEDLLLE